MNLHQYAKNQTFSSFCSGDIVSLKILQSDWSTAFWPISQEPHFFQVWDLYKNTANIIKNFFIDQIQKKLMAKFSNKFKKPSLWPIFGTFSPFWGQKDFLKKIWSCHAQQDMGS